MTGLRMSLATAFSLHPNILMYFHKTLLLNLLAFVLALYAFVSCRPKQIESSNKDPENRAHNIQKQDSSITQISEVGNVRTKSSHQRSKPSVNDSNRPTYENQRKKFSAKLAKIPPARSMEEYKAFLEKIKEMLDSGKDLLFSVPLDPLAQKDRDEAWEVLRPLSRDGFFSEEQNQYAKNLMPKYSSASQIQKLVIWEVVRSRIDYSMTKGTQAGSATGEILLKLEMAKLMLSALGEDNFELFHTASFEQMKTSDEAWSVGKIAEKEIQRIYNERTKEAEKILEQNWSLPL